MERILLIWQYPSQVSLGLWSSLIGTMLTWWISQKQIFYDYVLPFKTTKYGGQREKCNVKLDHNARITAGQSGPGKEAELGNFYSGTQKGQTVSKTLVSTISEWKDCMQKKLSFRCEKTCLNQIFQFAELVTTLRDALLWEKCSFFEHCSKGLWPPPPFYLNICPILQGVFFAPHI